MRILNPTFSPFVSPDAVVPISTRVIPFVGDMFFIPKLRKVPEGTVEPSCNITEPP